MTDSYIVLDFGFFSYGKKIQRHAYRKTVRENPLERRKSFYFKIDTIYHVKTNDLYKAGPVAFFRIKSYEF